MKEITKLPKKISFSILTLGCKVNTYESEAIKQGFEKLGVSEVSFGEDADITVINTCAVTGMADKKSRQMLHRAKRKSLNSVIVATGCFAQEVKEELLESGIADIVVGNNLKNRIPELALQMYSEKAQNGAAPENVQASGDGDLSETACFVEDLSRESSYEDMFITRMTDRTRAFIKIQDGCNQFCSYCIIPYMRGRIRSRAEEDVINEVKGLVKAGCKEVVLTGIHLSSYGNEGAEPGKRLDGTKLAALIVKLNGIDGLERIRLGSLEPRVVTPEFAKTIAKAGKLCPHFHLSLQSGSDATLKRMNRKYTAKEFEKSCAILRKTFDRPALTTDVIVGFPGETEEEFEESRSFLEKIAFAQLHVFKYSRRKGTVADRMPNQVKEEIKNERSDILLELDKNLTETYRQLFANEPVTVLTEDLEEIDGKLYRTGHSERYLRYLLPADVPENTLVRLEKDGTYTVLN